MSILTLADQPTYFPDVKLSGNALVGAIAAAQALAEGPYGANRKLELHEKTKVRVVKGGSCYLPDVGPTADPIKEILLRYPANAFASTWGRTPVWTTVADWVAISADQYLFDVATGELRINAGSVSGSPLDAKVNPEVRVTYESGFDFTAYPLGADALALKSALSGMLKLASYRDSGMTSFTLTDFYHVEYSAEGESGANEYLNIFKSYRTNVL